MKYHKEGPACGRIPYDPVSSEAEYDLEYPGISALTEELKTKILDRGVSLSVREDLT